MDGERIWKYENIGLKLIWGKWLILDFENIFVNNQNLKIWLNKQILKVKF